jgi:hypothetical protein
VKADATAMRGPDSQRANLWQTAKAVLCAFAGIRKDGGSGSGHLSLTRVVVVAVICAALFVLTLVGIVKWVVG